MARGRAKGDHEGKRREIADAACKVFLRLGLTRTSLADIAHEMGYTTGVLRHYFTDKDDLLLYVKNILFDRMHERALAVAQRSEGLGRLRDMLFELLPSDDESIDGFRLLAMFNGSAIGDPRLMNLQYERNERHVFDLSNIIAALQRDGAIPKEVSPKLEAVGLLALLDGIAEQQIMRPKGLSRAAMRALMNRYIDSLAQPKSDHRR